MLRINRIRFEQIKARSKEFPPYHSTATTGIGDTRIRPIGDGRANKAAGIRARDLRIYIDVVPLSYPPPLRSGVRTLSINSSPTGSRTHPRLYAVTLAGLLVLLRKAPSPNAVPLPTLTKQQTSTR